jgi:hypothetical protein
VVLQGGQGIWGEVYRLPSIDCAHLLSEMFDERGDVFAALAQGRQAQGEDEDAVKEILAEFAVADLGFEVAMCGDYDANIDGDGALAADAFNFSFFEDAEEFGLHSERHVADFVEKDCAVLGLLELAEMATCGSGEGSFFVAE